MREIVLEERRQRLERFITKVKAKQPPPYLTRRWADELVSLYLAYLRTKDVLWPNSAAEFGEGRQGPSDLVVLLYQHGPVSKRAMELKELLDSGNLVELANRLLQLASSEEGEAIESEIQTIYAKRKHKGGPFEDLLISIYKKDPRISGKQFEREVLKHVGGPLIRSMNDRLNEIVLVDGRVFSISGLEDRLSKLRAKY